MTYDVLKTRPRTSRGVLRWLMRRPATNEGAFRMPENPIRPIAIQMLLDSA
jgi:hypothetical protein